MPCPAPRRLVKCWCARNQSARRRGGKRSSRAGETLCPSIFLPKLTSFACLLSYKLEFRGRRLNNSQTTRHEPTIRLFKATLQCDSIRYIRCWLEEFRFNACDRRKIQEPTS